MDQAVSFSERVRAQVESLDLKDADLSERLCAHVDAAVAEYGPDLVAGEPAVVSAVDGGAIALAVLDGIARETADLGADTGVERLRADLAAEQGRLRALQADPRNVENLTGRELLARLVRGRRGRR